jgi:regulation of enolase protein 1 (concanavalin A-like superfamily)
MINLFDGLQGKKLPQGFSWLNEPAEWTFTERGLVVQAEPQTDYFIDPAGTGVKDDGHFLYTLQDGDFTMSTRVQVNMVDDYDAAVMMIMVDDTHWAKLCYEYTYKSPMIVSVVTSGVSDDCNSSAVPETGIYLRVTRFDNCFALHYSHDAKWWEMVRYFRLDSPGPVKVGVVAQSPTGNGCTVAFDHLLYSSEPVRDIRSGR